MIDLGSCFGQYFILMIISKPYEIPQSRIFYTKHFYFNIHEKCFASDKISAQVSYLFSMSRMKRCKAGILTAY
jgi:hypothetical protein